MLYLWKRVELIKTKKGLGNHLEPLYCAFMVNEYGDQPLSLMFLNRLR